MSSQANQSTDSRRGFLKKGSATVAGVYLGTLGARRATGAKAEALALAGGPKSVTIRPDTRWPRFGDEEVADVSRLILKPNYKPNDRFEAAWKKYFGCPFARAHCNGTSALGSALFALELPPGAGQRARCPWRLRRPVAKLVYVAQLLKTASTFGDWVPYALWKLERHTGTHVEYSERQRRHPFIWGWPLVFRVLRKRDLR